MKNISVFELAAFQSILMTIFSHTLCSRKFYVIVLCKYNRVILLDIYLNFDLKRLLDVTRKNSFSTRHKSATL